MFFRGTNLTHIIVVKPKQSGIQNSTHAIITYQKSEKNTDVQVRIFHMYDKIYFNCL